MPTPSIPGFRGPTFDIFDALGLVPKPSYAPHDIQAAWRGAFRILHEDKKNINGAYVPTFPNVDQITRAKDWLMECPENIETAYAALVGSHRSTWNPSATPGTPAVLQPIPGAVVDPPLVSGLRSEGSCCPASISDACRIPPAVTVVTVRFPDAKITVTRSVSIHGTKVPVDVDGLVYWGPMPTVEKAASIQMPLLGQQFDDRPDFSTEVLNRDGQTLRVFPFGDFADELVLEESVKATNT